MKWIVKWMVSSQCINYESSNPYEILGCIRALFEMPEITKMVGISKIDEDEEKEE